MPETLLEIEENCFLMIEQPELVLVPTLQKLGSQVPGTYIAVYGTLEVKI